jgi:energy-coupling factor transporter ATP-binding protein EcfA2
MQKQFQSSMPEKVVAEISALIPPDAVLVCIDGHSGVGKSRVAKSLAALRKSQLIQVDNFVRRDLPGRKYVPKIDKCRLHETVSLALSKGPAVVDGLCLSHLIPEPKFGRGFRIYVRSEGHGDGWSDEIDRRRELGTNLYHRRHNPEATADLVITVPYEI